MHGILPVLDLVANKYLENGKIMLITDRVYRVIGMYVSIENIGSKENMQGFV